MSATDLVDGMGVILSGLQRILLLALFINVFFLSSIVFAATTESWVNGVVSFSGLTISFVWLLKRISGARKHE